MADEAYNWIDNLTPSDYINANGSITKDARYNSVWPHYTIVTKIDTNAIINKWVKQKVSIPDYHYMGIPGKLPRPVLLIHGLDSDYEVWGVTSTVDKKQTNRKNALGFQAVNCPEKSVYLVKPHMNCYIQI